MQDAETWSVTLSAVGPAQRLHVSSPAAQRYLQLVADSADVKRLEAWKPVKAELKSTLATASAVREDLLMHRVLDGAKRIWLARPLLAELITFKRSAEGFNERLRIRPRQFDEFCNDEIVDGLFAARA